MKELNLPADARTRHCQRDLGVLGRYTETRYAAGCWGPRRRSVVPGSKLAARGSIQVVVTSRENGSTGHIYDTHVVAFRKHTLLPLDDCLNASQDDPPP